MKIEEFMQLLKESGIMDTIQDLADKLDKIEQQVKENQ